MLNLLCSISLLLSMNIAIITTGYVYTPNNSSVFVFELEELSYIDIMNANYYWDHEFQGVNGHISTATAKYNCHSYAWYSQNFSTNKWWMDDPYSYYSDGSYYEITSISNVQTLDRIIYLDAYGNNLHSGIVKFLDNTSPNYVCGTSNCVIVQSKWGQAGLYEHRGDLCPYTTSWSGCQEPAYSVKYYRRYFSNHTHVYTYVDANDDYHMNVCSCGVIYNVHNFVLARNIFVGSNDIDYIPFYECSYCGHIRIGDF